MVMEVSELAGEPSGDATALGETGSAATDADHLDAGETGPARRSGPPRPGLAALVLTLVMVASVGIVFFAAFAFGLSGLQEQRSQHQLYATFRGLLDPSSPNAPWIGGKIPPGAPVALVSAPAAGLHQVVVVEGTTAGDLLAGPGHLPDTVLPGQAGDSIVLGRAATAGAPFAHISDLRNRDVVTVQTGQGTFHYRVRGHLVNGGKLPTIRSTSGLLLLGTSAGAQGFASLTPSHVDYVVAQLEGRAVGAPHGRPTAVTTSNLPGHDEPGAWRFVLLWAAALFAATAACWWLWSYWGLLRTWLIGAPILFAILWALSNEAVRLLPNVY
jgi:sortase A